MKRAPVLLACLISGCAPKPAVLPENTGGWTRASAVRTFRADDLWRYVDGDAERYVRAGVERTLTANYRRRDRLEAVADVHEMKNAAAAQGIFESEQAAGSHACDAGDQCRLYGQMLTFRRGRCFVRLTAYQNPPDIGDALTGLAKSVDAGIARQKAE